MILSVNNLAVINSAEIELNGITVIAGKNGTGKSTIGKALYCLGRTFYRADDKVREEMKRQILFIIRNALIREIGKVLRLSYSNEVDEIIDNYYETGTLNLPKQIMESGLDSSELEELKEKIKEVLNIDSKTVLSSLLDRTFQSEFGDKVSPINDPELDTQLELKWNDSGFLNVRKTKGQTPEIQIKKALDSVSHCSMSFIPAA